MIDKQDDQGGHEHPEPRVDYGVTIGLVLLMFTSFAYLNYGPGLDFAIAGLGALLVFPFACGALLAQLNDRDGSKSWRLQIIIPLGVMLAIFPIVYFGFAEGLVCIAMVMPIWLFAALGGAMVSMLNSRRQAAAIEEHKASSRLHLVAWATIPFAFIFAEEAAPAQWKEYSVTRSIDIAASSDKVWPLLNNLSGITPAEGQSTFTHDMLQVPRPSGANIEREGEQLVRQARWGEHIKFSEVITALEPGRKIAWQFEFRDDSVQRHTDRHISPDGPILQIRQGQYDVQELEDGNTRLTLTTSYRLRSRLDWYLAPWGEVLLGDVSNNVLTIIANRAEG